MLIGLIGDVHANHSWLARSLDALHARGITTVIQVGDLGIGFSPTGGRAWHHVNDHLAELGMTMYVAPGNHDNYDQIDQLETVAVGWLEFRERILLAPRGHRSEHDGRTFVWLGGAGSVDRSYRLRLEGMRGARTLWWPQEAVTDADVEATIEGGHADVMISHDAPYPVPSIERSLTAKFDLHDVNDAHQSRLRFTQAVAAVRPSLLIHGHYHVPVNDTWHQPFADPEADTPVRVCGLARDGDDTHGVALLDTATLTVEYLNISG
ncbi:metallophosphoesterase family protein [Demequina globuliformis]|uniref:metallophosphoesterase family protein n=1 Tax=Demequina globuliformis TaxID=676202 RepID=UPI0007852A79|nr:metallophosphoesterase [Demequina globuliformis]